MFGSGFPTCFAQMAIARRNPYICGTPQNPETSDVPDRREFERKDAPPRASTSAPSPPPRSTRLAEKLTPEERHILLDHGTERPFCGALLDNKEKGTYVCRLCALPLFRSGDKFESGTGWPSFFQPFDPEHVREIVDRSLWDGAHRDPLRPLRQPSWPRLPRRPPADRQALLHEFGSAGV